jgi:CubicO group peptidase (beta-lactamase class C family)
VEERLGPRVADVDVANHLSRILAEGRAPDLHAVVAVRHGHVILEHYGEGEDFAWGDSLGVVTFGHETLHDVRSITKSVVGLLYGIALADGFVPEPHELLLPHFPRYPDLAADPDRNRLTVEHALTMTLGLEWNEDLPYTSLENSEIAMEFAPDRYRYVLERPIAEEPGTRWRYCGGATTLLGGLVARGSRQPLEAFAHERLFEPIGIAAFEWMRGEDGVASPASGLRLATRDLAEIGRLVLDGGTRDERRIVSKAWLDRALSPHVTIEEGFDYGYHWYLSAVATDDGASYPWVGGMGNGGQRLYVVPHLDLVVAIAAGGYDAKDQSATPTTVFEDAVIAGIGELAERAQHSRSSRTNRSGA